MLGHGQPSLEDLIKTDLERLQREKQTATQDESIAVEPKLNRTMKAAEALCLKN